MDVNTVVLHTTEGRNLPDYDGGALAPNLTAVPDIANKRLLWYQHFDIDTSSRALRNLAGGVETNTLNVCQIELVGTCDPATHKSWLPSSHIYWPEAPDWALAGVAEFLAWMHDQHGVPLSGPSKWPAYPASYGASNGARMSNSTWTKFSGVCGHLHVPENLHGDPGAIDFAKLIALAQGATEEDPMAGITKADIYDAVWNTDKLPRTTDVPDYATNPTWAAQSYLRDIDIRVRAIQAAETAQTAAITALAALVGTGVDTAAVVAAVQQAIADAVVKVDVNVTSPAS